MSLSFDYVPPEGWGRACEHNRALFSSIEWQELINNGLKSNTLFGWDCKNNIGITITVFKIGPFRVGYVGFPAGVTLGGEGITEELISEIKNTQMPCRIDIYRFLISPFSQNTPNSLSGVKLPETAIVHLQSWQPPPSIRRNIRKFSESSLIVRDICAKTYGHEMYLLYADTVIRNKGNIRYTKQYFEKIITQLSKSELLRCIGAFDGQILAGFVIVGVHGNTAYYLHGATNVNYSVYRVSDGLFFEMISWAKDKNLDIMNFMSSPETQGGLVRYKEKWGGVTFMHVTHEVAMNKFYSNLFLKLQKIHKLNNRIWTLLTKNS